MEISLPIILDNISISYANKIDDEKKPTFLHVRLLQDLTEAPVENTIYISSKKQLDQCPFRSMNPYVMCISDSLPQNEIPADVKNVIYITEQITLHELFFRVSQCFDRMNAWDFRLSNSVNKNEGIQALLNESESIFKNHIHIVEPYTKLLAYTKEIDIDKLYLKRISSRNANDMDEFQELKKEIRSKIKQSDERTAYIEKNSLFVYPTVIKALSYNDSYTIFITMVCKRHPYTQGVKDLLTHFCSYLMYYVKNNENLPKTYVTHESFFHGLLDKNFSVNSINIHAALTLQLPLIAHFNLYNIIFVESEIADFESLIYDISKLLPKGRIARYENEILLLNMYDHKDMREDNLNNLKIIESTILKYKCICGISNPFCNLHDFPLAYKQCVVALEYYKNSYTTNSFLFSASKGKDIFYHYDDYSLTHTLSSISKYDPDLSSLSPYIDRLLTIKDYDNVNNTKCMELLFIFLTMDQNIKNASILLKVPEKTIVEYMNIMDDIIYADLDSWRVRVKFLLVLEYLNLTPNTLID